MIFMLSLFQFSPQKCRLISVVANRHVFVSVALCYIFQHPVMNSIRKVKTWWRRTDSAKQKEEVLSSIPESRLPGISALPVEIWGLVLEHVVVSEMEALRLREWQLAHILRYRMVCRKCLEISRNLKISRANPTKCQASSTRKSSTRCTTTSFSSTSLPSQEATT